MHNIWSKGASSKGRDSSMKPMTGLTGTPYSSNMYAALDTSNDDTKRLAPANIGGGSRPGSGKAPSATMEKERMLQPFKSSEGDNRHMRGGGASRSSSRDNSARGTSSDAPTSLRLYAQSSQPPSKSASSEDISGNGTAPNKISGTPAVAKLTEEEVQKKTHSLLEEFLHNTNYKESEILIQETFCAADHSVFVREMLNDMLERTSNARINVGQLMNHIIKSGTITLSSYITGLNEFLSFAEDIAIDVPKFWPYTAEVLVPLLSRDSMSFADLRSIAQPAHGKLIAELLDLLVKDKGPGWIREKWSEAGLKLSEFIPEDEVDSFVKKYKLEYVVGDAATVPAANTSAPINWDHVQQKLVQFLDAEQTLPPSFDEVCAWISANVGEKVKDSNFIRALVTAICQTAIISQKTTMKLNEKHLQNQQKLIIKFVDNNEERELQCLYAIQALLNKLEHPQGLLCQIFQTLWDDGTISNDSFIAWQESNDPTEQAGKGVALKSLTTFFTALREGDEDSSCDES
ncbi:hypothetical protein L9F63_012236 [Diploptera punctata]|uniref:Eukaryotic translation initiation factor 4 gamma n=1 Tax=Diploptera punctata TaxID=6984 RepID=A0AAD8ADI7_DIPPU|nr:hypothetical protein L9F63_012236 [Diploptera punctata]